MKKLIIFLLAMVMMHAGALASDDVWLSDFEQAKQQAKERNVPILADFAGSDWCGWCMKLDEEVFSREEFQVYAKDNFVLFLADFPMRKKLDDNIVMQNSALQSQYGIQGFPTVLLLDSEGKVLGRTGYRSGGAESYVEHLENLLQDSKS